MRDLKKLEGEIQKIRQKSEVYIVSPADVEYYPKCLHLRQEIWNLLGRIESNHLKEAMKAIKHLQPFARKRSVVNYPKLKLGACSPQHAFAACFGRVHSHSLGLVRPVRSPTAKHRTRPLSSPSECPMHAGDMRLIDRSPYDRYITVFKYVSAIPPQAKACGTLVEK